MNINFAEFQPPRSGAVAVEVWGDGALTSPARQQYETIHQWKHQNSHISGSPNNGAIGSRSA
jgi:hypothetical protein